MRYLRRTSYFSLAFRLTLITFLLNLSIEASLIFLPLFATDLGATKLDVGLIVASYGMSYFISSFLFGRLSDMKGRSGFISSGLGLASLAYLLQIIAPSPLALLGIRGFIGFCLGISSAALMAYLYEAGGRIGSFASYGSLGWFFGAIVAAVLRDYEDLFITSAVAAAIAFALALTLREDRQEHIKVAIFPASIIWANRRVYLPFFLRQTGAQAIWAIFPLFLAGIGADKLWIAVINGINVGGQFIAMQFADRFNATRMFIVGLILSTLVFAFYGVASNYLQLIPVQIILSVAWSCLYVGALILLLRKNVERGTAVGILFSTTSLSSGVGPFLAGGISQAWGFPTLMFMASGLSFFGLLSAQGGKTGTTRQRNNKIPKSPPGDSS